MGIRLVAGRDFTEQDGDRAPSVVLVSETTAGRTWPAESAIGRQIRIGDPVKGPVFTVVGVVADARYQSLETPEVRPMMYFSALARPQPGMMIVVRGANTAAVATGVREAIAAVDSRIPTPTMRTMDDLLGLVTSTRRFALGLFAVFAVTSLLLAAVGIYGVMSYLVRQRMHELGIRLALGAPARVLLMSVVGRALRLTMVGVAVGLVGAWGLTRVLAALLFEVNATDRPTFAVVAVLLVIVAGVASLVPAYRATRADPLLALRGTG
jgi:ABC-type antimicrobial peptide transport system permease subunit